MSDEPTISLKLSEYDKLRDQVRALHGKNLELERDLAAAKLADNAGTLARVHAAFHDAIRVVQFAVGNLPPEAVAGWPHEALVKIADAIGQIPGIDRHISEVEPEFREFARVAASFEAWRAERKRTQVVLPATAADFGPKTPEAAAVHAQRVRQIEAQTQANDQPATGDTT